MNLEKMQHKYAYTLARVGLNRDRVVYRRAT